MNPYERYSREESIDLSNPAAQELDQKENPRSSEDEEKGYRVNGYQQVIEMLIVADENFRISLLNRIESADPNMGASLRSELQSKGLL